ncbi:hypothetical protein [Streptomyces sp. NPDC051211]|uniref:hypothetical protein n=1 Tax=Streptomyces sp. NPDC051211 TaxID=3154643 RepID=UPI00344BC4D5
MSARIRARTVLATTALIAGLTTTLTLTLTPGAGAVTPTPAPAPAPQTTTAATATATAAATTHEAENATISQGLAESNHTGYTGSGFVNYDNTTGG